MEPSGEPPCPVLSPQGRFVPAPGSGLLGRTDVAPSQQPRWTKATTVLPGLVKSLLCQPDLPVIL